MHSKRRKKRRLFRSLLFRLTSLHQLEEQQDTLKTLLASSSQKPLSSLSSFLERTTLRGVIGTLFDIGLVLRSAESSRAIHAVLGKALEDTAVVEDREVSASSSSHFRQLQRSSKRSDHYHGGRIRCIILSELSAKPLVAPRGRRRLADCVTCSSAYYSVVEKLLGSWILVDSFQEASAFQRSNNHAMELRDAGRRSVLDERRGADAATVGTRTQCEVDDRNYDSPVRRLHH